MSANKMPKNANEMDMSSNESFEADASPLRSSMRHNSSFNKPWDSKMKHDLSSKIDTHSVAKLDL